MKLGRKKFDTKFFAETQCSWK